jgi:very-short-patch-repair endonuclease
MAVLSQVVPERRAQLDKVRLRRVVSDLARRQWGVVARRQLLELGISSTTITRWAAEGRLIRIYPGVYAVGHAALQTEARLLAAILYAGTGAALSHETAAWWRGLLKREPRTIHVTTPHRRPSLKPVRVHHRTPTRRTPHRRLPITPVPQILLDLAATSTTRTLRAAIAEADHQRALSPAALIEIRGRGRPGSTELHKALKDHLPEYAQTKSELEDLFLDLCRAHGITLPEVNVDIAGWEVDAVWRQERFAVELDGGESHGTPAAMESDRRKDLAIRQEGYRLNRYSWRQVANEPGAVAVDVLSGLQASGSSLSD